jgi:integrase
VKLTDLRADHVEAMLAAMQVEGRGLVTQRRSVAVLSSALTAAVKRRLVTWNVCTQLDLPTERPERRPVWDAAELSRFLVHVEHDRHAALWRLYAIVGLRRGEVLALRWANVDLDAGSLRVEETLGEVDGKLVRGGPKTTSGKRTISLDTLTVAQLRATREHQDLERAALGDAYQDADLVFCREDGACIWPGTVTKRFGALAAEAGLPSIRLHDLRHSAASVALASGVDLKTVSSRLGHSSIVITADLYAHVLPATDRAAAEKVAEMVLPLRAVTNL